MSKQKKHKSGFINIIGKPNVGKSTLMNALVGERISIITSKAQTTRHRILGIVNTEDHQLVFSDTPGIIDDPRYKLHESMNRFVKMAFIDADVLLFMIEYGMNIKEDDPIIKKLNKQKMPVLILVNKIDLANPKGLDEYVERLAGLFPEKEIIPISALEKFNTQVVYKKILELIPEFPPYFAKDALTDKPERFFINEIIREKILLNYEQEIPYSVEVRVEVFQEEEKLIRIRAIIYVMRKTQKGIIIGKQGSAIKKLGIDARKDIEAFLQKQVYLELFVKVREKWRDSEQELNRFGY